MKKFLNTKNVKITILALFLGLGLFSISKTNILKADSPLNERLKGRILLQPEQNGEAWYINPINFQRYFLNRPNDAFRIMQEHGIGVTDIDLSKIPVGLIDYNDNDNDQDGLSNRLEIALKTNPDKNDSDNDGYSDYDEIINNYNPLGLNSLDFDEEFFLKHAGKIFLQIANNGEAWYLDPVTEKRYYLGLPQDAFTIMRTFALGISDENIKNIPIGTESPIIKENPEPTPIPNCEDCDATSASKAMYSASRALVNLDLKEAKRYFTNNFHKALDLAFEYQTEYSIRAVGGLLNDAKLFSITQDTATYKTTVYFEYTGNDAEIVFYVDKESDGFWRLRGL